MSEPVTYNTSVREMPMEERPRERLDRLGAEALSDAELIAILFRTGTARMGAVALANQVINHFGSLRAIARASLKELQEVKGLGRVKAIEVKAALELGKRLYEHRDSGRPRITAASDVRDLLMGSYKDCETEVFRCLLLNTKHDVLRTVEVSRGGLDGTMALPREVFRQAVREGATATIVCHNHPSGDPEPSRQDVALTRRLKEAAEVIGVELLDHVIFGDGRYVSLQERNLM